LREGFDRVAWRRCEETIAGKRLSVAFPDTVLEEHDTLREKTVKLGQIARACAVFGVDVVEVFRDPRGGGESRLIRKVLEYLETPQYLRRRLFPLEESLRYAGLLPPLRIPSHTPKVPVESLRPGEYREGVVGEDGRTVDVGLDSTLALDRPLKGPARVTVKLTSVKPLQGVQVDRSAVGAYWGYSVEEASVAQVLSDQRFPIRLATSRMGEPLRASLAELGKMAGDSRGVLLVFGSPSRGLFEMVPDLRKRVDLVLNLYPEQNVATVRTEEAISSALYLLEVLSVSQNTKV
jgi:predicted SPOUT superfamily RNA methylase MTH1